MQISKKIIFSLVGYSFVALFLSSFFYFFYLPRIATFGCFDDCNNFIGGYYLLKGKHIFTEFYFNHQVGMAYLSFFTQKFAQPETLYKLLLTHRIIVFMWSLIFSVVLLLRFKWSMLVFVILFEVTKYYVFGNRFLAESFIVYPLVYLFGLVWYRYSEKKVYHWEYIWAAVLVWMVFYMREPFIPLALILYLLLIFKEGIKKNVFISIGVLAILILIPLMFFSLPHMFMQLVVVNQKLVELEVKENNTVGLQALKIFFYPLLIFFTGKWTIFRQIEMLLGVSFFVFFSYFLLSKKPIRLFTITLFVLGIAAVRYVDPGTMYYQGFRLMIWYALFIAAINLMLLDISSKKLRILGTVWCIGIILFSVFSPQSFLWFQENKQETFNTGYGLYYVTGSVIKTLATPHNTLFLEARDDMILWEANIRPAYKYQFYTGLMPGHKVYRDAREEMFTKYPPDFYYGDCYKSEEAASLTSQQRSIYQRLYFAQKPTCLYLKKSIIPLIPGSKWESIKERFEYHL